MALIDAQNRINKLLRNAPDAVASLGENIIQLEDQRDELQLDADAVDEAVCGVAETDLTTYLNTIKLAELSLIYPAIPGVVGPLYIVYGATYGTIDYSTGNISDWDYRQDNLVPTPPPPPPPVLPPGPPDPPYYVRYVYTPGDDPLIDTWVTDYAYGNDLLTKPLDTDGTYGLLPSIDQVQAGINLLNDNKDKVEAGIDVFARYIP